MLSCCEDEDEDKILDSLVSAQGDDDVFQERERFALTALEAQVVVKMKMKTKFWTLWCLAREMMDFFQERERFGLTALEALSVEESQCRTVFITVFIHL